MTDEQTTGADDPDSAPLPPSVSPDEVRCSWSWPKNVGQGELRARGRRTELSWEARQLHAQTVRSPRAVVEHHRLMTRAGFVMARHAQRSEGSGWCFTPSARKYRGYQGEGRVGVLDGLTDGSDGQTVLDDVRFYHLTALDLLLPIPAWTHIPWDGPDGWTALTGPGLHTATDPEVRSIVLGVLAAVAALERHQLRLCAIPLESVLTTRTYQTAVLAALELVTSDLTEVLAGPESAQPFAPVLDLVGVLDEARGWSGGPQAYRPRLEQALSSGASGAASLAFSDRLLMAREVLSSLGGPHFVLYVDTANLLRDIQGVDRRVLVPPLHWHELTKQLARQLKLNLPCRGIVASQRTGDTRAAFKPFIAALHEAKGLMLKAAGKEAHDQADDLELLARIEKDLRQDEQRTAVMLTGDRRMWRDHRPDQDPPDRLKFIDLNDQEVQQIVRGCWR